MRTIEFRAKRIKGGWVYGDFLSDIQIRDWHDVDDYSDWAVDPETVGQFTGLLDKNGKKIFEGDIVNDLWSEYVNTKYAESTVTYLNGRYSPLVQVEYGYNAIDSYHPDRWEIIGNIHDKGE